MIVSVLLTALATLGVSAVVLSMGEEGIGGLMVGFCGGLGAREVVVVAGMVEAAEETEDTEEQVWEEQEAVLEAADADGEELEPGEAGVVACPEGEAPGGVQGGTEVEAAAAAEDTAFRLDTETVILNIILL